MSTYRDGVGVERCRSCRCPLRSAAEEPLTMIRVSDLEAAANVLRRADAALELLQRLEQALGRNVWQLAAGDAVEPEEGYGHGV